MLLNTCFIFIRQKSCSQKVSRVYLKWIYALEVYEEEEEKKNLIFIHSECSGSSLSFISCPSTDGKLCAISTSLTLLDCHVHGLKTSLGANLLNALQYQGPGCEQNVFHGFSRTCLHSLQSHREIFLQCFASEFTYINTIYSYSQVL